MSRSEFEAREWFHRREIPERRARVHGSSCRLVAGIESGEFHLAARLLHSDVRGRANQCLAVPRCMNATMPRRVHRGKRGPFDSKEPSGLRFRLAHKAEHNLLQPKEPA